MALRKQMKMSLRAGLIFILILGFMTFAPAKGFAQVSEDSGPASGPRKHLATIVFSGLGGAILGLSTLSFYGRPQDKLGNIGIGFALGVIAGTSYVTYMLASKPHEFYSDRPLIERELEQASLNPRSMRTADPRAVSAGPLQASWTFEF